MSRARLSSRVAWLATVALVILPAACKDQAPAGSQAYIRVVNASGRLTRLDALVDDAVLAPALATGDASPWLAVTPGTRAVGVRGVGAGSSTALQVTLDADDSTTVFAVDLGGSTEPRILSDTNAVVPADRTKLRAVHLAPGIAPVDIWRTQPDFSQFITVMFPFDYADVSPYLESTPGTWRLLVSSRRRDANNLPVLEDTLLLSEPILIPAGELRTVVITADSAGKLGVLVDTP
ncbi:MAG: DUF4397 domain-containing protein [Gemmatimonadota bacterium]|nr:DUF4397 domain-containing protein [Gemmatimonadota bacterium]